MPHSVTRRILAAATAAVNLTQVPLEKKKTSTKREPPVPKQPKQASPPRVSR